MRLMTRHSLIASLCLLGGLAYGQAPSGALTADPARGGGSVTPTLTWNITNAVACTASGAWSGAKPASGTETLPAITADASYTLTCTGTAPPIDGRAFLQWIAPTQNTDGSPITNLAAFTVHYGRSAADLDQSVRISPPATTYTVTGLTAGQWFFGVRAENALGYASALSNVTSKTITQGPAPSAAFTAAVVVDKVPGPPTGLQVIEQTAYDLRLDCSNIFSCLFAYIRKDYKLNAVVGTVAIGTPCREGTDIREEGFYTVNRSAVDLIRNPRSSQIAARCAA